MCETQELLDSIVRGIPKNFNFPFGPYIVLKNGHYHSYGDAEHVKECMEGFDNLRIIEVYWRNTSWGKWVRMVHLNN